MKRVCLVSILVMIISLTSCSLITKKEPPKTITPEKTKVTFKMKVNSTSVFVNGEENILDVPVKEIDGRTMVPLKFLTDFLGAQDINYDPQTEEVTFTLER